jgi:hypothetical protein
MLRKYCVTLTGVALLMLLSGSAVWCEGHSGEMTAEPVVRGLQDPEDSEESIGAGSGTGTETKSVARAMILSAVLPGLGQMYAGGQRGMISGGAMAATDVFSIWRYFANNAEGDDKKAVYEAWARDHYSRERFERYVRDTVVAFSRFEDFDFCKNVSIYDSSLCWEAINMAFPLSETGSGAYYEQIDVEDLFVFGWDDWDPSGIEGEPQDYWDSWEPFDEIPEPFPRTSPNRQTYSKLRAEAEDFYGKADRWAWIMVIGRVVSMVDAAILVKMRNRDLTGFGGNPRLSFKPKFGRNPGFKVSLKMRF